LLASDPSLISTLALWAAPRGIGPYLRQHLLDKTFQGLYHTDAFDRALLIPYFIVLVLLAGYGMHRYIWFTFITNTETAHDPSPPRTLRNCRV